MRDNQRQKVYDAEQAVRRSLDLARQGASTIEIANSTLVLPTEVRFGSIEGAQRYVDQVMATGWYGATWPGSEPVTVVQRVNGSKAHYVDGKIALHDDKMRRGNHWAMREIVVLHELAHHVTQHGESHGGEFCGAFLHLVKYAMGPEVGLLLMDALYSTGCSIKGIA